MAWRPYENLISGELDNTELGKVVGWMKFKGIRSKVKFDLKGDFHRDIRGSKIKLTGEGVNRERGNHKNYMHGFSSVQTGSVGDITAGLPPQDYCKYPYIEWYSDQNGRCVIELDQSQLEIIGKPIPWMESFPVDRKQQGKNMMNFIDGLVGTMKKKR
jgi:hypothetical protein